MRPESSTPGEQALDRVPDGALRSFERGFGGSVIRPDDDRYDRARRVWNALVNRYPALVVRPTGPADVASAVEFARKYGLKVSVLGGGHGVAGSGVRDGALVVDCSRMKGVRVDPDARTARVEPGVRVGEALRETQRFGLAPVAGTAADTGIAGSTLGGGISWLRRKHGMGVDNLRSVDLVTADGGCLTASGDKNTDLFWGIRGGGGSLGIVTSFELDLHPVGPEVATAMVYSPEETIRDVLRAYREYATSAPDEVTSMAFLTTAPESQRVPESARGEPCVGLMACYAGPVEEGIRELEPLRDLGDPILDDSGVSTYRELHDLDSVYPHDRYYYWKSLYLDTLTDEAVDRLREHAATAPSSSSSLTLWQLGGEMGRVDPSEAAFAGRDGDFLVSVEAN